MGRKADLMRWMLLVFLFLMGSALHSQSILDRKITMEYEDERLDFIFSHIQNNYDLDIRFNKSLLPTQRETYSFDQIRVRDVLDIVCRDNNLAFREYAADKVIIFPGALQKNISEESSKNLSYVREADSILTSVQIGQEDANNGDALSVLGSLIDQQSNEPISSAMILNLTTGDFGISDDFGNFRLDLRSGKYIIQFTSITHQTTTVEIEVKGSDQWIIGLVPKAHLIDEIVISGKSAQSAIKETITGLEQLSRTEIKQLSSFMGEADVVKSLLTVAGVSSIGEGASGFNVRGGSIDQNLILQDGILVMNPSHILGFFSTFNPDIVLNTSLNKGHIPAYYGGRISSVLDVDIKEASTEQFKLNGGIGFISTKVSAEIPVVKQQSGLLVSGRLAYASWLKSNIEDLDIKNSQARFNDIHVKYSHRLNEKDKIIGSYFQSYDKFRFSQQFGYSWQNRIGNLQYKRLQSENLSFLVNLAIGDLRNTQFEPEGPLAFELKSGMKYLQAKAQVLHEKSSHTLRLGADIIGYGSPDEEFSALNDSQAPNRDAKKENGREMGFYINDQWDLGDRFSIDLGLRYSIFSQLGPAVVNSYQNEDFYSLEEIVSTSEVLDKGAIKTYSGLEPRVSFRYSFSDDFSMKASYNRLYQYIHLLSNSTSPTPVDIWQVSNTHIQPLQSDNYSVGLFHKVSDRIDYSLDFYYRQLDNTIDHKDFADLLLNEHLETEILKGEGRAYGAELSLKKSGEKLSGRFSYSYSRSERRTNKTDIETINLGKWFPSNFDQPHNVKFFINWQLSRRDRFDVNFTFGTGRPITAPTSNYLLQGVVIPGFTERNDVRLPDYHRLDIGYTFTVNRRRSARYRHEFTLAFYNLYARKNVFSVFFRQRPGTAINALQLSVVGSVIPSITYNFRY